MEKAATSNYDKVLETWRQKFLAMDQNILIRRFCLEADENALYITYFSRKIRIDRKNGHISYVDFPGGMPGFNT